MKRCLLLCICCLSLTLSGCQSSELLLNKYPEGMTANYYAEGFGTIKSVILDTAEKRYSICWLGQEKNGWTDYFVPEKRGDYAE